MSIDSRLNLFRPVENLLHLGHSQPQTQGATTLSTTPIPTPAPAQPATPVTVITPPPVAASPVAAPSFWATFFQKLMATEEALVPIFVPNDAKAQGIAAAVLVTTSTFASIFGVHPTNPAQ